MIYLITAALISIVVAIVFFRHFSERGMNKPDLHVDRHHDDEHLGEEHNEPERAVKLHEEDIKEFGIEVEEAGRGTLTIQLELPGEITPNADRLAHIVPRAAGVVVSVFKSEGERVRTGELLAVLDSRELADVKASYLAAIKRTEIARTNAEREKELWKKRISPELDYLEARRILDESTIELNSVEQKLHAYGLSDEYLRQLPLQPDMTYTRYELRAPFEGTIIEKHITIGEVLREDSQAFVIADLSSVWVNISVYQKDMASLRKGQSVSVSAGADIPDARGTISFISPITGQDTRTAIARVVLPNPTGVLRPGLFVTVRIAVDAVSVPILIPRSALVSEDGGTEVFVQTEEGFTPQSVTLGRRSDTDVEVVSGLAPGQRYVTKGVFTLKAQMSKGTFGDGHNH